MAGSAKLRWRDRRRYIGGNGEKSIDANKQLCTDLDVDAVARYVIEEDEYIAASAALRKARRDKEDLKTIESMQRLKNAAFKCVDTSAKSIGLTVDARLRFDLREPEQDKPENRFARFQAANGR